MNDSNGLTAEQVADRVRPYVAGRTVGDVTLTLDEARIHLRNDYWRIPIRPSHFPERLAPYYEELAIIEEQIEEREGLHVTVASGNALNE